MISIVTDKVFPDRFLHIPELCRLGASIRQDGASGIITGGHPLTGACVMASDLRASAALLLAAVAAEGDLVIRRIYHLDRGYERLDEKLNRLGALIERVTDAPEHMPASLLPGSDREPVPPPKFLMRPASVSQPKNLRDASLRPMIETVTSATTIIFHRKPTHVRR